MKSLAQDVGGLKKVLSNVKMRGTFGEVQLGALLEQMMSPEQYEANVKTKKSGTEFVEFAIKLPEKMMPTALFICQSTPNSPKMFTNNTTMLSKPEMPH